MPNEITTQELQDALNRLTDAINDASGLTQPLRQMSQATGAAATGVNSLGAAVGQNNQAIKTSVQRQREMAKAASNAAGAVGKLAGSMFDAAKAMYEGQKGARAFNSSLDSITQAVTMMGTALAILLPGGPLIKGLVAGLTFVTTKLIGTAKAAGEMSDALYKGYQGISRSGAAASDGMTGLLSDVHKLGMGFQDLDRYTSMIAEGRRELVLFGGTVFEGRKRFADMGQAMLPFRESLMNAGMTQEEINEASMGYLRLQSRIGQTQNKTTQELAEGARKYLIEQDALTKLTGMTRKEQEDAREEIRSQERFAAQLAELRAKGLGDRANELENAYLTLASQNKLAAQGFADLSTGMITTEAAQKSMLGTQGESMRAAQQIQAGQLKAAEAAQRVAAAHGRTAEAMRPLAQMGVYGNVVGDFAADLRLGEMSKQDIAKQLEKIEKDRIRQGVEGGKAADKQVQQQTDLVLAQQRQMIATQKLLSQAIEPSMTAFQRLMVVVESVTLGLEKMLDYLGWFGKPKTAEQKAADAGVSGAESQMYQERMKVIDAERKLREVKNKGIPEEIKAAEAALVAAKESQKAARSSLLDAQVKKRYADDRATGRTGAGHRGEQLRADGTIIAPGDEDYAQPQIPQASGALTGFEGATGVETQTSLADKGLKLRPSGGDIQKDDAAVSPKLIQLAKRIQDSIDGFGYFSGFNDKFHHGLSYASKHTEGLALDFVLNRKPSREQGAQIVNAIKAMGANKVLDEYNNPSPGATAGHIHVEVPEFARGGIATGPKSGYNTLLHGTEAVVPLPDGKTIPVSMNQTTGAAADNTELLQVMREVKSSIESMTNRADNQRVVAVLEDSIRAQRTSNDILGKILQMSQ